MQFLEQGSNLALLHWESSLSRWTTREVPRMVFKSRWLSGKEFACNAGDRCRRHRFHPLVGKSPWRRKLQPTPVSCLKNPMDRWVRWASPQGRKELDMTRCDKWVSGTVSSHKTQCFWYRNKKFSYFNLSCSVRKFWNKLLNSLFCTLFNYDFKK